jgi:NADH pyrophosphatase NudC (nudix superfamily)
MARYINADVLQQKITQMRLNANGNMDVINALWDVQDTILQSPTADVQEAEQGEWVLMSDADGYFCACASCGEWSPTRKQLKYCPNCGESKKITDKWLKLDYGKNAVNPYP